MPEIPFAFQWTIPENQLLRLKDSVNEGLWSTPVSNIPEFEYYLEFSPNGDIDERRGKTMIFLQLRLKNVKKVETDYSFTIESVNSSLNRNLVYESLDDVGRNICSTEEFFDPEKKFIVDGKFNVKVNGIFKYETENNAIPVAIGDGQQKWIGGKLGDEFWKKDGTKDFTINNGDGKEIKAHRFVLANRSEVFNTIESTAEISNFPFAVVETGVKLIYDCNFTSSLSLSESMQLLQFLDEFDLPSLKVDVEPLLITQISAATVCRLTNCSVQTHSTKLKEKCMEFLMAAFQSKTALSDIKILNKNIALQILKNSLRQTSEIVSPCDAAVTEHKWEGGELGDKLWNDNETKDFTIFVDGEEIKAHKFILGVQSQMFKEISKTEDTNENEAEIFNFSPKVVEIGIKLIYDCNFTTKLSMEDLMQLQHFFDKYQLPALKDKVEPLLIAQISAATVCRLTNCSILTNSPKLKAKCIEFLMAAFESKTPLSDVKILNKDVSLRILQNSVYPHVQTVEL